MGAPLLGIGRQHPEVAVVGALDERLRGYKLEHYIKPEHFELLAKLMLAMSLVMTFVYATEFFMAFSRGSAAESEVFKWRATGTVRTRLLGGRPVQQRRAADDLLEACASTAPSP